MSAKHYSDHEKGDGGREQRCEQPARLTNTSIHLISPSVPEKQLPSKLAVPRNVMGRTIAFCDQT